MLVKDIKAYLSTYDDDDELIIAWWDNESFDVSKEDFKGAIPHIEKYLDTSHDHNMIEEMLFHYSSIDRRLGGER